MIVDKMELEEKILYEPALKSGMGCTYLRIVTGYTDVGRISKHLLDLKDGIEAGKYERVQIELILGMVKSGGLSKKKHEQLVELLNYSNNSKGMPKIKCYYVVEGVPVHSKVYVWSKGTDTVIAFCGSANYSMNAFGNKSRQREYMEECKAKEALSYFRKIKKNSVDCFDEAEVASSISFASYDPTRFSKIDDQLNLENLSYDYFLDKDPVDQIEVSLLKSKSRGSDVGYGSGVNWGIRQNGTKRNPNQAYIPYNKADKKKGFFPDERIKNTKSCPIFKVVTKEKGAFYMRIAQSGEKGIHSAQNNAIIGEYLRERLGVPGGTFITKSMLENYGRTKVTFKKYFEDDEYIYVLEF